MKVAITGASGYVGSCLAEGFRRHGHDVLSLSRRPCDSPWHSYALGDDPHSLPWDGVDALVHAAYDFNLRTWPEILEKNVTPSVELLRAAHQAKVKQLVFISSMSCFENCRSDYGKAKWRIEQEALQMGASIIRPGLVWGERSGGVMGTLEKLVTKLPIVPFLIGGKNSNQFLIHENDLSEAILAIVENSPAGTACLHSVMHPTPVSLLKILKSIAARSGKSRIYLPVPWQLAMTGLKSLETLGMRPPFRSDSLIGLVYGNPTPENTTPPTGVSYRALA